MTGMIQLASLSLGIPAPHILSIISQAPRAYKHYQIVKRSGGMRDIYHPSKELKVIQRWISKQYLEKLPVHPAASAYRGGMSVKDNAARHIRGAYFLKLDFQDFFPSIKYADLLLFLEKNADAIDLPTEDCKLIARVCCRRSAEGDYSVPIGAPSSPVISNSILFDFDSHIAAHCESDGIIYSRYADDLVFSTREPNSLKGIEAYIRSHLYSMRSPSLRLNESKKTFISRKHKVSVTGMIITPQGPLSIGRERKREVKALVHKYVTNQLEGEKLDRLRGLLGYIQGAEPSFIEALRKKYGDATIYRITHRPID